MGNVGDEVRLAGQSDVPVVMHKNNLGGSRFSANIKQKYDVGMLTVSVEQSKGGGLTVLLLSDKKVEMRPTSGQRTVTSQAARFGLAVGTPLAGEILRSTKDAPLTLGKMLEGLRLGSENIVPEHVSVITERFQKDGRPLYPYGDSTTGIAFERLSNGEYGIINQGGIGIVSDTDPKYLGEVEDLKERWHYL
jgi:hypothetical protein